MVRSSLRESGVLSPAKMFHLQDALRDRRHLLSGGASLSEWPRLRSLVRRYLLIGDVTLHDGAYDSPRGRSRVGLDTDSRCQLVSVLVGIKLIQKKDPVAGQLLVRDIGTVCELKIHKSEPGHCHRIPRGKLPLIQDMSYQELDGRTEQAVSWLLSIAG